MCTLTESALLQLDSQLDSIMISVFLMCLSGNSILLYASVNSCWLNKTIDILILICRFAWSLNEKKLYHDFLVKCFSIPLNVSAL